MKRRWLLLAMGIGLAATLAYFLRGSINERVIVPLAYLWYRVGIYYHSVSEDVWWMVVIVVTFVICLLTLANISDEQFFGVWNLGNRSTQGEVEELMGWMIRLPRSLYHKWLTANRLGRLARLILVQREGDNANHWDGSLNSSVWNLPEAVSTYLKAGLKRPPFASKTLSSSSPLNLNPQQAVEYLESQMEDRPNGN